MELNMRPYAPLWEDDRWYVVVMKSDKHGERYFAATHTGRHWYDGCGCDLTKDGWELIAISDELPLLAPGPVRVNQHANSTNSPSFRVV